MRKTLATLATIATITPATCFAGGIPTIDAASVTQLTMVISEVGKQIDVAKDQLSQLEKDAENYEEWEKGFTNFTSTINSGSAFTTTTLSDFISSDDNIKSLLEVYKIDTDNSAATADLENELKVHQAHKEVYNLSVQRNERMDDLLSQLSSAETPAEKRDLEIAINFEQMRIQNESESAKYMSEFLTKQRKLKADKVARENIKLFLGDGLKKGDQNE